MSSKLTLACSTPEKNDKILNLFNQGKRISHVKYLFFSAKIVTTQALARLIFGLNHILYMWAQKFITFFLGRETS